MPFREKVLALDGALRRCGAWVVSGETILAGREADGERRQAAHLSAMARDVLAATGLTAGDLGLIAVTVGPGSFTGIRAALALAHGLALGAGVPVVGVTLGEALAESVEDHLGRELWVATDSRRGRVFLERGQKAEAFPVDFLPVPDGPVAIAGDQAMAVAVQLAAKGYDIMLTDARVPDGIAITRAAVKRQAGGLSERCALPLYIDAPEVRLPAAGYRPPPLP